MAYKIVKERKAWWPVSWKGVGEEGEIITNKIELRFRLLKVDEAVKIALAVDGVRAAEETPTGDGSDPATVAAAIAALPVRYAELVMQIADDWRGVQAENGEPLPFGADNLALLMNEPGLFGHVFEAFRDCINAREEAKAGN